MRKVLLCCGLLSVLGAYAGAADTQDERAKRWWGVDVGVFHPTSSEIRDAFDENMFRIGFRPFEGRISDKWKFIVDVTVISANQHGNKLFALPISGGFTRSFGDAEGNTVPFVQVGVGPAYYDYSITRPGGEITKAGVSGDKRFSTKRVGANANVELGVVLNKRFAIVGRYDYFTKADDFDFSGASLTLSYAVAKW